MKLRMFGKAQAALEFLTTYGWAFLIILIMIGTLAYFGILNPSKILPDRCNFDASFKCHDFLINGKLNTFQIRIQNNVGEPISVTGLALSSDSSTSYSCTAPALPTNWENGGVRDLAFTVCNTATAGLVSGEKGKVFLNVTYYNVRSGAVYVRQSNGEIFTVVR